MRGLYSIPQTIKDINNVNVPSANELLWTTTLSYCNVYDLVYYMFISAGIPIQNLAISDNDSLRDKVNIPLEFIKLREASTTINDFVFENINLQYVTNNEDINTGLKLWNSIEDASNEFLNSIAWLSNQINIEMLDMHIQQESIDTADPLTMMYLYSKIFDQIIELVSKSTVHYKQAFIFLEKYNTEFKLSNKQVSYYN